MLYKPGNAPGVDNRKVMAQKMLERYPAPGDAERPQQD